MYYATSATAVLEFIKGSLKPSRFRWLWHAHWTKHSLLRCCGRRQLTSVTGRRPAEVADRNSFNIHTPPRTKRIRGSKGRLYHWRDVTVWRNATRQKVEFVWSAACFSRLFSTNVKGLSVETFSCLFNSFLRENGSAICGSASRLGVGRKPEECWFDSRQGKRFKFFFFSKRPDRFWSQHSCLLCAYRESFPGSNEAGLWSWQLSPPKAEVKWSRPIASLPHTPSWLAFAKFEVLVAVLLKIHVFWDVTLCRWVNSS
jgi:hypothetical protein